MKIKFFLFICLFCIISTAYSQIVVSLHPLYTEQDAVLIPGIEGLWSIPYFDMTVSFQKAGDNFYLLKYGSETNPFWRELSDEFSIASFSNGIDHRKINLLSESNNGLFSPF